MGQIAVLTRGLWRLRGEIAALTGMTPVRWEPWRRPLSTRSPAGGTRRPPTARGAWRSRTGQALPRLRGWAAPLGPSRSGAAADEPGHGPGRHLLPAPRPAPICLAHRRIRDWLDPDVRGPGGAGGETLRAPEALQIQFRAGTLGAGARAGPKARRRASLCSTRCAATPRSPGRWPTPMPSRRCWRKALADDPAAEVVVKLHPDVLSGRRAGYFSELKRRARLSLVAEQVNPWSLLDSGRFGLHGFVGAGIRGGAGREAGRDLRLALLCRLGVHRGSPPEGERRARGVAARALCGLLFEIHALFRCLDASEIDFETAAEQLAWLRDRFLEQAVRPVCYRITRWKRPTIDRMLDGPAGRPDHTKTGPRRSPLAKADNGPVVAWASRDIARLETACSEAG